MKVIRAKQPYKCLTSKLYYKAMKKITRKIDIAISWKEYKKLSRWGKTENIITHGGVTY